MMSDQDLSSDLADPLSLTIRCYRVAWKCPRISLSLAATMIQSQTGEQLSLILLTLLHQAAVITSQDLLVIIFCTGFPWGLCASNGVSNFQQQRKKKKIGI